MDFEAFAETTAFRQVAQTITALSTQDERIADEFRAIETGRISSGKIVEIEGDVPVGMKMKLDDFAEAISTQIWETVGRVNWRSFEDARAFVRHSALKSAADWVKYCGSGKKPSDVPSNPNLAYAECGWSGMGDWLGTGRIADRLRKYRTFKKARAFARGLGFKSKEQWDNYCKSGNKPHDIPTSPQQTYRRKGWSGWGDWLGTGTVATFLRQYQSFKTARAFVRRLSLKSETEWREYCKSGKKPADIPANPNVVYAKTGWSGMGDWLGTRNRRGDWRPFKDARIFARRLNLKSETEWREYCKSGKKPADIPVDPRSLYAESGWSGWGDWLGTGNIAHSLRQFRSFTKAHAFVRKLGLKSQVEWKNYCKSGKNPQISRLTHTLPIIEWVGLDGAIG
jgi:hypothetical protein